MTLFAALGLYLAGAFAFYGLFMHWVDTAPYREGACSRAESQRRVISMAAMWPSATVILALAVMWAPLRNYILKGRWTA